MTIDEIKAELKFADILHKKLKPLIDGNRAATIAIVIDVLRAELEMKNPGIFKELEKMKRAFARAPI